MEEGVVMTGEQGYRAGRARRLGRRTVLTGVGTGAAALALAACSGGSDSDSGSGASTTGAAGSPGAGGENVKRGGTLQVPTSPWVAVLDPHQATQPNILLIWHNISHHLIELNDKLQATADGAASSWESPDPLSFVFKLHQGITFHDKQPANGRAFTADDVVYSLNRIATPEARFARRAQFARVDKIEAVDPLTVKISMKEPYVPMLMFLGSVYNVLVNREAVEKFGDLQRPESKIGIGPFMLEKYDKESSASLVRNPKYFRQGLPYLDRVEITSFADDAPRQAALRAGQLHLSGELIRFVPELLKAKPNLQQIKTASVVLYEFGMNQAAKPFDDIRVRKAIHLVLDRDTMLAAKYGARENGVYAAPVPVVLEPFGLTETELAKLPGYRQPKGEDIAEAKKLLAAAGFANGFKIGAKTADQYLPDIEPFIPDLKQHLNIEVDMKVLEWGAYKQAESLKETEAFGTGYIVEAEPDANLRLYHHSKGTRNYVNFSDAKADELIDRQARELDVNKRAEICREACSYLIEQVPHGWHAGAGYAVRLIDPKVHGIVTPIASVIDRQDYTRTWIG
jgi:peptide/nickel transport system substrate-binding protein